MPSCDLMEIFGKRKNGNFEENIEFIYFFIFIFFRNKKVIKIAFTCKIISNKSEYENFLDGSAFILKIK